MLKTIALITIALLISGPLSAQPEPPDIPARLLVNDKQISLIYHGDVIFKGEVRSEQPFRYTETGSVPGKPVNQVVMFQGKNITIEGEISGSEEAFPCEADRNPFNSYDLVRHSVGVSHSLLNRAVYDRRSDWALSVDRQNAQTRIIPAGNNKFRIEIRGTDICLRFRPRFYQRHRGLAYFRPWEYQVPEKPVVGWCSWFAFWNRVTEEDIRRTADVLSEKLVPYGLEYLQIDDGYQQNPVGWPDTWLVSNSKFPGGMKNLAAYIGERDLIPGIWTHTGFIDEKEAKAHSHLFVLNKEGVPDSGKWVGYSLDGSNPKAIDRIIRPTYKGFRQMGWKYFKVDALRHLRYDGYNSNPDFFGKKGVSRSEAFRNVVKAVREEIGPDNYLMTCWGAMPDLIGLADACRIGTDGYGLGGLSQYNSFNQIVWLNDPDHIEAFGKFAYRDCMATSLTGSLYMITDKPENYKTGNIDPVIRTIPVLHTLPGQLYDVDPSRTLYLDQADTETTGGGERIFDAGRDSFNDLFLLEISKPFENWMVLGRTGDRVKDIEFSRLGLDPAKKYLVFDFWHKKYVGSFYGGFIPGSMDPVYKCQLFCIRNEEMHPQLAATNRHISCGALELRNISWQNNRLSGESELVANDEYIIYITEPEGFGFSGVECTGATVLSSPKKNNLREIHLKSPQKTIIQWTISYKNPA